jgi:fructose-1,6-bisphosphatase II
MRIRNDARIEYELVRATEAAAIAAGRLVGRGDKNAIDGAAVDAMRSFLGDVDIAGMVVIGEGEKDEAPMLYIGEYIGTGDGPALDVAVDPIDGTTLASRGGAGAIAVVAAARRGSLFHTHVAYMDKIVTGPAGRGVVGIDRPLRENIRALAAALDRPVGEITVALLDRERNADYLRQCREIGARVHIFGDGDVARGVLAALPDCHRIDMLAGIGGAPEGVVTAVAVKALGGEMQGRLWPRDEHERRIALDEGHDPERVLTLDRLCAADDGFFAATGVTDGDFLQGVRYGRGCAYTQSLIVSTITHSVRTLDTRHVLEPAIEFAVGPVSAARHVGVRAVGAHHGDA